jgi:chloramphenicol O-acetyltransferase
LQQVTVFLILVLLSQSFNYLGSTLNVDNEMNIEIAEKIAKFKKAYCANSKRIKSKLLKENTETNIYKTMIRPVVTYSSETGTLTAKDENNRRISEWQILTL